MGPGDTTTNKTMPLLSWSLDSSMCTICGKGGERCISKHTICQWVLSVLEEEEADSDGNGRAGVIALFYKGWLGKYYR